jgi:hypothetical protein
MKSLVTSSSYWTVFVILTMASFTPLVAQEYSDVLNQGGMGVYAYDGASMVRQANGLKISISVPTPTPGEYTYAPGTWEGHPEVFTLWAFVFNYPSLCDGPCDGNDLGDTPAR